MGKEPRTSEDLAWLFFKVNLMVVGLGFVIYLMYFFSHHGLPRPVASLMGLPSAQSSLFSFNWCDTRVTSLNLGEGTRIYQRGYKWFRESGAQGPVELDFIAVEKWFAQYCKVRAERLPDLRPGRVVAVVNFVNGDQELLRGASEDEFRWRDQVFRSPELAKALSEAQGLQ